MHSPIKQGPQTRLRYRAQQTLAPQQHVSTRLGQRLAFSPQQQHALKILQQSGLELDEQLAHLIDENPFLERIEDDDTPVIAQKQPSKESPGHLPCHAARAHHRGVYPLSHAPYTSIIKRPADAERDPGYDHAQQHPFQALRQSLIQQAEQVPISRLQRGLVFWLIDQLDEQGYLPPDSEHALSQELPGNHQRNTIVVKRAIAHLQEFEPSGVGARNLAECLQLQLHLTQLDGSTQRLAHQIIESHLALLSLPKLTRLQKELAKSGHPLTLAELEKIRAEIRSLTPYPVDGVLDQEQDHSIDYIQPDLRIVKQDDRWEARLYHDNQPKIRISKALTDSLHSAKGSSPATQLEPLQHAHQAARWLLKQIENRQNTLLRVAQAIVSHQQAYFDAPDNGVAPLKLDDISEQLGLHRSTVSRAVQDKYLLAPWGVIALKSLFSKKLLQAKGDDISASRVGELIRRLILEEPAHRPLSDQTLTDLICDRGIHVARRTVSKYRQRMRIPASHQRKQLTT